MWFKVKSVAIAAVLTTVASLRLASAGIDDLMGDWRNADPATRGIVRIAISGGAEAIDVHIWGACHPSPCDWGSVKASAFAANVNAALPEDTVYLQADFLTSFSMTRVIVGPVAPGGPLQTLSLTHFTDGSNRSDYATASSFIKSP
jgi:hypothetical protein